MHRRPLQSLLWLDTLPGNHKKAQGSMERLEQPPGASRLPASLRSLRRKDEILLDLHPADGKI